MKHLLQSRAFVLGFTAGMILCVVLNYFTYLNNWCNENIYDCYWYVGFPVPFAIGQGGGYGFDGFIWTGLVTDFFFLIAASVFVGWVFVFVESKI